MSLPPLDPRLKHLAFAFVDNEGTIDIATVSQNKKATMVNAIVMLSDRTIIPMQSWTHDQIVDSFNELAQKKGKIKAVSLTVLEDMRV